MATKDELITENAELREKVAALEADNGGVLDDGLYVYNQGVGMTLSGEVAGVYTYDREEANVLVDGEYKVRVNGDAAEIVPFENEPALRVRAADGTFAAIEKDGVYRYDGSGDLVAVDLDADIDFRNEAVRLASDVANLKIQRDEARNEVARLKDRLKSNGALHGSVDDLPVPY